jgi:hypothetical protein
LCAAQLVHQVQELCIGLLSLEQADGEKPKAVNLERCQHWVREAIWPHSCGHQHTSSMKGDPLSVNNPEFTTNRLISCDMRSIHYSSADQTSSASLLSSARLLPFLRLLFPVRTCVLGLKAERDLRLAVAVGYEGHSRDSEDLLLGLQIGLCPTCLLEQRV